MTESRMRTLDADWDGVIVVCAANHYDGVKLADQHVAERLAALAPVLYVDPPFSAAWLWHDRKAARSLTGAPVAVISEGLARYTPVVPPKPNMVGISHVSHAIVRRGLRRVTAGVPRVRAVVSAWPLFDVFGPCHEQLKVYWAQDDFVGGAELMGLDPEQVARGERRAATAADLVVSANPEVHADWQAWGLDGVLIPYGADVRSFAAVETATPAREVNLPGPIAIVIGHLNARIDIALLEAVADGGTSVLLVGPRADDERLRRFTDRPNVQWVGPKPFAELPSYLRHADVGLVPYGDSAFNRGSFPLKTLEYLAAGLPVVATSLPATRWLATDLITIEDEPAAFAEAVRATASKPRNEALVDRRRRFAEAHSYDSRAATLLDAIDTRISRVLTTAGTS